jgi:hypothetical protein
VEWEEVKLELELELELEEKEEEEKEEEKEEGGLTVAAGSALDAAADATDPAITAAKKRSHSDARRAKSINLFALTRTRIRQHNVMYSTAACISHHNMRKPLHATARRQADGRRRPGSINPLAMMTESPQTSNWLGPVLTFAARLMKSIRVRACCCCWLQKATRCRRQARARSTGA